MDTCAAGVVAVEPVCDQSIPASMVSTFANRGFAAASTTCPITYCSRSITSDLSSRSAPSMISGMAASAIPAVAIAAAWSATNQHVAGVDDLVDVPLRHFRPTNEDNQPTDLSLLMPAGAGSTLTAPSATCREWYGDRRTSRPRSLSIS